MRTLFVTVDPPYPPASGAPLRNWQNISLASEAGATAVVSVGYAPAPSASMPKVGRWQHVVVRRTPEPGPRGYPVLTGEAAAAACAALEGFARSFAPDVVVFENIRIAGAVDAVRDIAARIVLDSHNVYLALAAELRLDVAYVRTAERAALEEVDEIWVCSTEDAERIRRAYAPRAAVRVVPNGVDVASYAGLRSGAARRPRRRRLGMLFVGAFWYEPNRIAGEELALEILPRVRAHLDEEVRLYLVGAAPSAAMLAASTRDDAIVVTGRVADVRPYLGLADVVAVPLRQGGGTRLKLLEAFAAERAVVATAKAAEGLAVRDGEQLLLREGDDAIAEAVCALLRDPQRAAALASAGRALVDATYSWDALRPLVHEALAPWAPSVEAALGARDGAIGRDLIQSGHLA